MTATVLHVPFYDDLEWTTSWPSKMLTNGHHSPIGRKVRRAEETGNLPTRPAVAEITRLLTAHAPDDYCEALAERIRWRFCGPRLRLAT